MPITIPQAAARLRDDFAAAEALFDAFQLRLDSIKGTILAARAEAGVPVHAGQETLLRLQRVNAQALGAQNDLFRAHDSIARIGRVLMGPEEEYTPESGIDDLEALMSAETATSPDQQLRLVA